MMNRLEAGLKTYPNIKLVIFEPGPNEKFKPANLEASGNILAHLQENKIPTIYVSNTSIQSDDEAEGFAKKYGAYYYGRWKKNIPRDNTHNQFDEGTSGGHLTVKGCELWAENMLPLVLQVMKEKNIR